jgi:L-iditol 2-dehydrogenase
LGETDVSMKATILVEPGKIELQEVEMPKAGPGEVVVRVRSALTCGTDLKAFRRGHPKIPMPTRFGHEFSGDVWEVGEGVEGFKVGDQVMCVNSAPCGECEECRRGLENLCTSPDMFSWGAFAEYMKVPARIVKHNMFKKPPGLSYSEAAMLEPLACVVYGLEQVRLKLEDTVLIIGAGPIGLLHVMVAKVLGAGKIIVSGRRRKRLKIARLIGADVVIDAAKEDVHGRVMGETGGVGASLVVECTGQLKVWEESTRLVARGGTVILFGGLPKGTTASFDTARLHYDQITLKGVFHFTRSAVRSAYDLLASGRVRVKDLITGSYTLDDMKKVIDQLIDGNCIKIEVVPQ